MLKIETPNNEDKVLLHSCCAPCSSAIIECLLANNIRPTVFYYNPNIYPQAEYDIRKAEAIRYVKALGLDFIDGDYDYQLWRSSMSGMEDEPERGGRCLQCFTLRLTETAAMPQSMVSRYSPLPLPLPAGKVSTRLIWQVVALPLSIPAPSSGNRTGEKEDYRTAEINFLKSMTSTINNIAVASSVCGGLKKKNKNIRSQLIFLHQ